MLLISFSQTSAHAELLHAILNQLQRLKLLTLHVYDSYHATIS